MMKIENKEKPEMTVQFSPTTIGFYKDGNPSLPAIQHKTVEYTTLSSLFANNPELANQENAVTAAKIVLFLGKFQNARLIDDPIPATIAYRQLRETIKESPTPQQYLGSGYQTYAVSEYRRPEWQEKTLKFYYFDECLGVPYRCKFHLPMKAEEPPKLKCELLPVES